MDKDRDHPDIKDMWGCMFAGDLATKKLQKRAIAIIGDSRIGKSTLFNYIQKIPLIGVQIQDGIDVIYEVDQKKMGVQTKPTFESVTLVPNLNTIQLNYEQFSLVDLAGFHDQSRSYVGVFGVSFMIQKILQLTEQIKFVLAISHSIFQNQQIQDVIKPFQSLTRILNLGILVDSNYKQVVDKFINSIAVVVNKAKSSQKFYLAKLKKIIQSLKKINPQEISNQRKTILMLIQSIVQNKRIQLFKKAEDGLAPPQCDILENLNQPDKKWDLYNFADPNNLKKDFLFQLPFEKDLNVMKDAQKQNYKRKTQDKKKYMNQSYKLLQQIIKRAVDVKQNNWLKQTINYSEQFKELKRLMNDHPYGSYQLILSQLKPHLYINKDRVNTITRLKLANQLKKLSLAADSINDADSGTPTQKIIKMTDPVEEILNICRNICCKTKQQQEKFLIFTFINLRSLYQSQMQSKVDKKQGAEIPFVIKQILHKILPMPIVDLLVKLIIKLKPNQFQKQQYQEHMKWLIQNIDNISDSIQARQILICSINFNLKKVQKLMQQKQFLTALNQVLQVNQKFINYMAFIPDPSERSQKENDFVEYKYLQIYKIIGQCLEQLKYRRLAIMVYEKINAPSLLKKCFKRIFAQQKNILKKYDFMRDYIESLQKYADKQQMIKIYKQMIDEFECYPKYRKQLKQELAKLLEKNLDSQIYQYRDSLRELTKIDHDPDLLEQIKKIIQDKLEFHNHDDDDDDDDEEVEADKDLAFQKLYIKHEPQVDDN